MISLHIRKVTDCCEPAIFRMYAGYFLVSILVCATR